MVAGGSCRVWRGGWWRGSSGVKCPQHKSDPQYGRKKARGKWKARVCRLTCISPVLYRQWLGTSGQERGPGEYRFDPASGQAGSSVQVTVTGANFATCRWRRNPLAPVRMVNIRPLLEYLFS